MFGITEVSIKVIPPVYHCTRVHQFPASLLVLGTSPIIIPRTRVYILIAVVPKHFCCVKAEGLEQPGSGNYISHEIRNSWIRPCTLSLRNFRPLDEGMRGLDCASPCFPIEYSTTLWIVQVAVVDGNIQGHGLGNFKGGQNGWIKTKWSALEIRREN